MFGAGAAIKAIAALVIVLVIAGGMMYVSGLRADLAVSQENTKKMVDAVEKQQEAINEMKADQNKIKELNSELNTTIKLQNKDILYLLAVRNATLVKLPQPNQLH
jgi:hypothetical protein